jgi:hypothetical protein
MLWKVVVAAEVGAAVAYMYLSLKSDVRIFRLKTPLVQDFIGDDVMFNERKR